MNIALIAWFRVLLLSPFGARFGLGVWKWRNKVVNASDEDQTDAKKEDIFPFIQRLSKLWISARCKRMSLNWSCWIPNPRALFDSGHGDPESSHRENSARTDVFTRLGERERNVFTRLGSREPDVFSRLWSRDRPRHEQRPDPKSRSERQREIEKEYNVADRANRRALTPIRESSLSESENIREGHWKSKSKKQKSSTDEDDLSQPWLCEKTDQFTPQIPNFAFPKRICMSGNVKTYDGT
ncbi:hypothetical protein Tco_0664107 [Tanacetum coccineum]